MQESYAIYDDGAENVVLMRFDGVSPVLAIVTPQSMESTLRIDYILLNTAEGDLLTRDLIVGEDCKNISENFAPIAIWDGVNEPNVFCAGYEWYFED